MIQEDSKKIQIWGSTMMATTFTSTMIAFLFLKTIFAMLCLSGFVVTGQQCEQLADQPKAPYVSMENWVLPPSIDISDMEPLRVVSHCRFNESLSFCDAVTGEPKMQFAITQIGHQPQFGEDEARHVLDIAVKAYAGGTGEWTAQYTLQQRIMAVRNIFSEILENQEEMIRLLMWEISKNQADAEAEILEVFEFLDQLAMTLLSDPEYSGQWTDIPGSSTTALTRRTAVGIVLVVPFALPLSDTYRLLLPALLTGNVCILKLPMIGGLVHMFTMDMFAKHLPPGALSLIASPGPLLLEPVLGSGKIDALALIGTPSPTDTLLLHHPHPHKFRTILQLGAKNMAVMLPDLFEPNHNDLLDNAYSESILGSLTYSGQLDTAMKIYFVPKKYGDRFALEIAERVERDVTIGQPWQTHVRPDGTTEYSLVTPIPNFSRIHTLTTKVDDAARKGARVINDHGGERIGGSKSTLLYPFVLYPLEPHMQLWEEEAPGPIIMIATYEDLDEPIQYAVDHTSTQQVSVFGQDVASVTRILDRLGSVVSRINLNTKCSRFPETLPHAGRRSTGLGVLSVADALKEFTVPTVIAHKSHTLNDPLVEGISQKAVFLGVQR
jgi:glyceraldehyde-3-phosphate dehydrogenase (NADP+)